MYIPRYPTLSPKYLLPKKKPSLPFPLNQENIGFYNFGRTAIYHAIEILKLLPGEEVLMPSYVCLDVLDPFLERGIKIRYYDINKDLSINTKDIEKKIEKGARVLFFIHYFGFPQSMNFLQSLKQKYNIILIEDCAHAFLGQTNGVLLGTLGDVSIFSLKKMLPVHNVGILLAKNIDISKTEHRYDNYTSVYNALISRFLDNIKFRSRINFYARNLNYNISSERIEQGMPRDQSVSLFRKREGIVKLNERILGNLDYKDIVKRRRGNFKFLLECIKNIDGVMPIFSALPDGVCPMAMPLIIENSEKVCKLLNIRGIDAFKWPFLPNDLGGNFEIARYVYEKIIVLPIHQDLGDKHLDFVAECLRKGIEGY